MMQMNLSMKQKLTHRHRERTCDCQGGREVEKRIGSLGLADAKVKVDQSYRTLCDPMDYIACLAPLPMEFSSQNTGVGSHSLLQGIFPTQGLNPVSHISGGFFIVWATREAQADANYYM